MIFDQLHGTYYDIKTEKDVRDNTKRYMEMLEQATQWHEFNGVKYPFQPNKNKIKIASWKQHNKKEREWNEDDRAFWDEEFKRIENGHKSLSPSAYYFYNYKFAKPVKGRSALPKYRRYQAQLLGIWDYCLYRKDNYWATEESMGGRVRGNLFIGPRQIGKSEAMGAHSAHTCHTHKNIFIGYNAHEEKKAIQWLDHKVKQSIQHLPIPLKLTADKSLAQKQIIFGKELSKSEGGGMYGRNCTIEVRAPSLKMWDGATMVAWYADEGPIIKDFDQIFMEAKNALWNPYREDEGVFFSGGVAGEFNPENPGFLNLVDMAEELSLSLVFIPGWSALNVDEFGNEDVEQGVYTILKERLAYRKFSEAKYNSQILAYPLTLAEAKLSKTESTFNFQNINNQIEKIERGSSYKIRTGEIVRGANQTQALWKSNEDGKVILIEHPKPGAKYLGAIDVHDYQFKGVGSSSSLTILKGKANLSSARLIELNKTLNESDGNEALEAALEMGYLPVCHYADNPRNPKVFAQKSYLILLYFGCKASIERHPSPILSWYLDEGLEDFVAKPFHKKTSMKISSEELFEYGQNIDKYWKDERTTALTNYYEDYCNRIFIPPFLTLATKYNPNIQRKKKDPIDSFGLSLLYEDQSVYQSKRSEQQNSGSTAKMPGFKKVNGRYIFG